MRKIVLIASALIALLTFSAAAIMYWNNHRTIQDSVRGLKRAVTKDFHDPESARFRSVRLQSLEGGVLGKIQSINLVFLWRSTPSEVMSMFRHHPDALQLCGEVNAKNGFGAYVGYKHFVISGHQNPKPFIEAWNGDNFAERMCDLGVESVIYSELDSD